MAIKESRTKNNMKPKYILLIFDQNLSNETSSINSNLKIKNFVHKKLDIIKDELRETTYINRNYIFKKW